MTKVSRARWLKNIVSLSGIDTKGFSAHSYRWASLSSAYNKGASLNDILKSGAWTNADTFINHYYAHVSDTAVGQIILDEYNNTCRFTSLASTFLIFKNNLDQRSISLVSTSY